MLQKVTERRIDGWFGHIAEVSELERTLLFVMLRGMSTRPIAAHSVPYRALPCGTQVHQIGSRLPPFSSRFRCMRCTLLFELSNIFSDGHFALKKKLTVAHSCRRCTHSKVWDHSWGWHAGRGGSTECWHCTPLDRPDLLALLVNGRQGLQVGRFCCSSLHRLLQPAPPAVRL